MSFAYDNNTILDAYGARDVHGAPLESMDLPQEVLVVGVIAGPRACPPHEA